MRAKPRAIGFRAGSREHMRETIRESSMRHRVLVASAVVLMALTTRISHAQSTAPQEPNAAATLNKSSDDTSKREARRERHRHRQAVQHRHRRKH